jgi:acetyl esterase/lipase
MRVNLSDERNLSRRGFLGLMGSVAVPASDSGAQAITAPQSYMSDDGTVEVGGFALPSSQFLSADSHRLFIEQARLWESINENLAQLGRLGAGISELRAAYSQLLLPTLRKQQQRHATVVEETRIAGVGVQRVRPSGERDPGRLLISLHGGGFSFGEKIGALIEAIPIAAVCGIEVVSIDYRMAPEHSHPAAVNDVIAVFMQLLRERSADSIGLFGSSAGALLAAQVASQLIGAGSARPGALGMFALGAGRTVGDSFNILRAIDRLRMVEGQPPPYLANVSGTDPSGFPAEFSQRLSSFPPSLLISSTRDLGLSSIAHTHAALVALGVPAELHVWEGLRHCFYYDPAFTESAQMYDVVAKFFRARLASGSSRQPKRGGR